MHNIREKRKKGASYGLQETPDGRQEREQEVLCRRMSGKNAELDPLYFLKHFLHVRPAQLKSGETDCACV